MARIEHPLDIFGDDIDFEIDDRAGRASGEVGRPPGLGDDRDLEPLIGQTGNRQADAIDRHGAFFNEVAAQLARVADPDDPAVPGWLGFQPVARGVDVALDEVPPILVVGVRARSKLTLVPEEADCRLVRRTVSAERSALK